MSASQRPDTIPVIVDVPRADPGLGFQNYVNAVAGAILGGTPAQYTVGLYGPWGTGKSSILFALRERLEAEKRVTTVLLDAWRHERADNLLGPLVYEIRRAMGDKPDAKEKWTRIFGGMELSAFGFGFRVPASADRAEAAQESIAAYMRGISALSSIGESIPAGERVVVFVDDLDRCSPDRVLEVVEAIRLVMDVPGFVFVLAIDYDVLVRAVETRYPHADAHHFVEKIVQVPFRIPSIRSRGGYLEQIVPDWAPLKNVWFRDIAADQIESLVYVALRDNPRQVKRVLNAFMVAKHIDWDGLYGHKAKSLALLELLALQAAWPSIYQRLVAGLGAYERSKIDNSMPPNAVLGAVDEYKEILAEVEAAESEGMDRLSMFLNRHLTADSSFSIVLAASRMASDSIVGESRLQASAFDQREFFDYVVGRISSLPFVEVSVRNEALSTAALACGPHEVKIIDVMSSRGLFTLAVPASLVDLSPRVHSFAKSVAAPKRQGKTARFVFGGQGASALEESLDSARKLLIAIAGQD
ncbi:KAP family P-loop NTPase fold protein [Georgenia sp. Marseille-Q6866]